MCGYKDGVDHEEVQERQLRRDGGSMRYLVLAFLLSMALVSVFERSSPKYAACTCTDIISM